QAPAMSSASIFTTRHPSAGAGARSWEQTTLATLPLRDDHDVRCSKPPNPAAETAANVMIVAKRGVQWRRGTAAALEIRSGTRLRLGWAGCCVVRPVQLLRDPQQVHLVGGLDVQPVSGGLERDTAAALPDPGRVEARPKGPNREPMRVHAETIGPTTTSMSGFWRLSQASSHPNYPA
ncbi:MAG: hypothetical protein QOF18_491, partial [Frankiaceae bacterium]|nr:hypothetical protein [Frankiaceae bacterium]